MGSGSRSNQTGSCPGTNQPDDPKQVRLVRIYTTPVGAAVSVGGHPIGKTTPQGLSVPWNQGEISITRFLYTGKTLSFGSKPPESEIHVELQPAVPFKTLGIAAACAILIAVLGFFLWWTRAKEAGIVPPVTLSIQTVPGDVSAYLGRKKKPVGKSDSSGRLSISVPGPGPISLRFEKDYFEPKTVDLDLKEGAPIELPKVSLKRIKSDMLVTTEPGRVNVAVDGAQKGTTDDSGKLLIKGVPVGSQLGIVFSKKGYPSVRKTVFVDEVDVFRLPAVALKPVTTRLEITAAPPSAKIYVKHDGDYELAGETDQAGRCAIENLPKDKQIHVKIVKPGWHEKVLEPFALSDTRPSVEREVKLDAAVASVQLQTDAPGTSVKLDGADAGKTDEHGKLTLPGLQVAVPHELELSKEGFHPKKLSLTVPDQYAGTVFHPEKVSLQPEVSQKPIELVITTEPAGVEVSGSAGDRETSGTTDKDGKLSLTFKEPVKLRLTFKKDYFEPQTKEYDLTRANARGFPKVVLKRTHGDLGVKTIPGGVHVAVEGEDRGISDEAGALNLSKVPVGKRLHFVFKKEGYASKTLDVELPVEASVSLDPVKLAARAAVEKPAPSEPVKPQEVKTKLILEVGVPMVTVSVTDGDGNSVGFGLTNRKGKFGVAHLPMGKPIRVRLMKKGWQPMVLGPFVFSVEKPSIKEKITLVREEPARTAEKDTSGSDAAVAERPVERAPEPLELTIRTDPAEVEILVGDSKRSMGTTDDRGQMKLNVKRPGSVTLHFRKRDFKEKTVKFNLNRETAREPLTITLEPSACDLVVRTIPAGVDVFLEDGRSATSDSRGRLVLRSVPAGEKVKLTFKKPGFQDLEKTIEVPARARHETELVTLEPVVTKLHLRTNVPGADVLVRVGSGTWKSKTNQHGNLTVYGLPMGKPITVTIEKGGFKKKTLQSFDFSTENPAETLPEIRLEPLDEPRN